MNHLDIIREKVIAANSEVQYRSVHCASCDGQRCEPGDYQPIRLADVLLALSKARKETVAGHGLWLTGVFHYNGMRREEWNLRKDSLEDQSPETIQFLAELLK